MKYRFNAGALVQDGDQGIAEPKGQWMYGSNGYWYQRPDGTYPYDEKILIDDRTYYFNESGYMQTGWQWIDGSYYYFNGSGHMLTNWQWIDGYCYYFYSDGHMAKDETIGGSTVDSSGAWIY